MNLRTMLRHPFAPLYIAAAGVVLLAAGAGIGAAIPNAPQTATPDMTMADCALWENGNTPQLPANTYTDRCWDAAHQTVAYSDPADAR